MMELWLVRNIGCNLFIPCWSQEAFDVFFVDLFGITVEVSDKINFAFGIKFVELTFVLNSTECLVYDGADGVKRILVRMGSIW